MHVITGGLIIIHNVLYIIHYISFIDMERFVMMDKRCFGLFLGRRGFKKPTKHVFVNCNHVSSSVKYIENP